MKAGKISSIIQKIILRLDEQVRSYYAGQFISKTYAPAVIMGHKERNLAQFSKLNKFFF